MIDESYSKLARGEEERLLFDRVDRTLDGEMRLKCVIVAPLTE